MNDFLNHAALARDEMKKQNYPAALNHVELGLVDYLNHGEPEIALRPWNFFQPIYGNLVAAFQDMRVLSLMEACAQKAVRVDPEISNTAWDPSTLIAEYWATFDAMGQLLHLVKMEQEIPLDLLFRRAGEIGIGKAKSRLNWLEKIGMLHFENSIVVWGAQPSVENLQIAPQIVPPFSDWSSLNAGERGRFYRTFKSDFEEGLYTDLHGEFLYGIALLHEVLDTCIIQIPVDDGIFYSHEPKLAEVAPLRTALKRMISFYPDTYLGNYSVTWLADLYFLQEDFQAGWNLLSEIGIPLDIYVNLSSHVSNSKLSIPDVTRWLSKSETLTQALMANKLEVDSELQILLDNIHTELNKSFVSDLWERLIVKSRAGEAVPKIAKEFDKFLSQDRLEEIVGYVNKEKNNRPRQAFENYPAVSQKIKWPSNYASTYWFAYIVRSKLQSLYREAENIVRTTKDLPAVGEGWVNEVLLLRAIREAFPQHHVIHQGRPKWLGMQSLDIYLPDLNIAIEYQGEQHSRPVSLFGGEDAFTKQLERDRRKAALCFENGCKLVEVFPGFEISRLISELSEVIEERLSKK